MLWVRSPPGAPRRRAMSINYKSFREQHLECIENGNLVEIDISKYNTFPKIVLTCLKYKCACNSGACRDERITEVNMEVNND